MVRFFNDILVLCFCCELFRSGVVRAATMEEIQAEKSLIEKDSVSVSNCSLQGLVCGQVVGLKSVQFVNIK